MGNYIINKSSQFELIPFNLTCIITHPMIPKGYFYSLNIEAI